MKDFDCMYVMTLNLCIAMKDGVESRFIMAGTPRLQDKYFYPALLTDIAVVASAAEKLWEGTSPAKSEAA